LRCVAAGDTRLQKRHAGGERSFLDVRATIAAAFKSAYPD